MCKNNLIYSGLASLFILIFLCVLPDETVAQRSNSDHDNAVNSRGTSGTLSSVRTSYVYDIYLGKSKIGTYNTWKIEDKNTVEYHAKSTSTFSLLGKITIDYSLQCTFKNGDLVNSEVTSLKNGKPRNHTLINWNGSTYDVEINGKKSTVSGPVQKTSIMLYYDNPNANIKVFSESEAKFKDFNKESPTEYVLADVGKSSGNDYTYSDEVLQKVSVSYVVKDFTVVRR